MSLPVSGQTRIAELQEIYDEVVVQKALELHCKCELDHWVMEPFHLTSEIEAGSFNNLQ